MGSSKRIGWLDFAKGIGIMLVVWAHANAPFKSYIYQFHMPFFFLISGYLYNQKDSVWAFIKKRIYSLYIPFVFWNVLIIIIRYLTQYVEISAASTKRLLILTVLTLDKDGRVFGATWFMGALFVTAIFYKLLDALLKRFQYRYILITVIFALLMIFGFHETLKYKFSRTLILGFFYAVGYLIRIYLEQLKKIIGPVSAVIAFGIFAVIGHFNTANMGDNKYSSPFLFVVGALLMSYAILYFSCLLEKIMSKGMALKIKELVHAIGKQSVDILIWQFAFFRVVTLAQILKWQLPLSTLLEKYPTFHVEHFWWVFYFIAGTGLSILWGKILRSGPWGKGLKKLHIV